MPKREVPVILNEGEKEYDVEDIVGRRIDRKGKVMYEIKWKGYSSSENTWEPKKNLNPSLVKKYENCRASGKKFQVFSDSDDESESGKVLTILDKKMRGCIAFYSVQYENELEPQWDKTLISEFENNNLNKDWSTMNVEPPFTRKRSISSTKKRLYGSSKMESKKKRRSYSSESSLDNDCFDDKSYAIEKIIDHTIINGVKRYRVRWENYGSENDSWLTLSDFDDENFVWKYEKKCAKKITKARNSSENTFLGDLIEKAKTKNSYRKEDISFVISKIYDSEKNPFYLTQLTSKDLVCIHPDNIPIELENQVLQVDKYNLNNK
uniref:Chromo domain-containing protein n=1 Tax=Parastrongyloides trichosuri TaxID=131310 RepID=A0A0N4ZV43_PARTI